MIRLSDCHEQFPTPGQETPGPKTAKREMSNVMVWDQVYECFHKWFQIPAQPSTPYGFDFRLLYARLRVGGPGWPEWLARSVVDWYPLMHARLHTVILRICKFSRCWRVSGEFRFVVWRSGALDSHCLMKTFWHGHWEWQLSTGLTQGAIFSSLLFRLSWRVLCTNRT